MEAKLIRKDVIRLLCDFLETWIHEILYQRHIYPAKIFSLKKKFQVGVHIAQFPDLSEYISNFVESCLPLFEQNEIKSVSLSVIDSNKQRQLERFVFEINPVFENLDKNILAGDSDYTLGDLEQHLRACLLKLGACNSLLETNKSPCSFKLILDKAHGGYPNENLDLVDWIPNDEDDDEKTRFSHIIPLKLVSMDILRVNTFIYEAKKKGKEREQ